MSVLIEHQSGFRLDPEEALVAETLKANGHEFAIASLSQVRRGRRDATKAALAVGGIDFMAAALHQRGISLPLIDSYPAALAEFLHRRIWRSTLRHVLDCVENGRGPVFVKPALRAKRFTGMVIDHERDWRLQGVPLREPVWCSEPVKWLSEWRVYVVRGEVRFIAHYDGEASIGLDVDQVQMAVGRLAETPESPSSYAVDFGVLAGGKTALVELNDGFAIGAYGIDGQTYIAMLQDRWNQLTSG